MKIDEFQIDPHLSITFTFELGCPRSINNPEDFIVAMDGNIQIYDDNDQPVTIGRVKVIQLQVELARSVGVGAFDLLDFCSKTAEYLPLIKTNGHWTKVVHDMFQPITNDLIVLDRIEIGEPYRRRGLSLLVLREVIGYFADSCGLIACIPFPLQFENIYGRKEGAVSESQETAFRTDRERLRSYWSRLGFERVPRTGIMALSPQLKLRSYAEVFEGIDLNQPLEALQVSETVL